MRMTTSSAAFGSSGVHRFWRTIRFAFCASARPARETNNQEGLMKSRIAVAVFVAAMGITPAILSAATTESQATLRKEAKISMKKARSIALKKAPGKVSSSELERENGKLIYSFDIKTAKGITEVLVSAIDGHIVDVSHETAAKEAAEKKKEAQEKKQSQKKTTHH